MLMIIDENLIVNCTTKRFKVNLHFSIKMRAVSIVAFGLGLMAIAASFVPILYSDKSMAELVAAVRYELVRPNRSIRMNIFEN